MIARVLGWPHEHWISRLRCMGEAV